MGKTGSSKAGGRPYNSPKELSNTVNDAAAAYGHMVPIIPGDINKSGMLKVLKGGNHSDELLANLFAKTELSLNFLAESVFEITPKTLRKYKNEEVTLPSRLVEHIVQLISLYALGEEIFGSTKEFNEWMNEESIGLGYYVPNQLLKTTTGLSMIYEELKRIEFGATA